MCGEKEKIDERGVASILSHNVMNRSSTQTHTYSLLIDSKQQETEIETFVLLLLPPDRQTEENEPCDYAYCSSVLCECVDRELKTVVRACL
jgi:hypothetical protein